ncbi:hypothetical protein COJ71_01660 [Bacillus cereus]|nr:hypothetical protein COJ71_01660 [Bacillus cereus]
MKYIGATQNISAIFKIYRLIDKTRQKESIPKCLLEQTPMLYYFSFKKVRSFKNKFQKKINPGNKIAIPIAYRMSSA